MKDAQLISIDGEKDLGGIVSINLKPNNESTKVVRMIYNYTQPSIQRTPHTSGQAHSKVRCFKHLSTSLGITLSQ